MELSKAVFGVSVKTRSINGVIGKIFTLTPNIGVYPVGSADSWSSLDSWVYTGGAVTGNLSLTLGNNLIAGQSYELRLYADDGYDRLATSAAFVLNPIGPTVIASSTPAILGNMLNVTWSGISNPATFDWIGVYALGSDDYSELDYVYTNGGSSGTRSLMLSSPALTPGQQYELRLFSDNSYNRLASGGQFTLASASGTAASFNLYYVHNDHLGTPKALTDETGSKVWGATHDPFGAATVSPASSVELNLRFPGQYYDKETGLYYNLHRYYDPNTGRYITSDPIGLMGGINTFAYVGNNPLIYIDPLGLCWVYSQSTGQLTHVDANGNSTHVYTGYSGHGDGVNNPNMQHVPNVGPINRGTYTMGPQQNNVTNTGRTLTASMRLIPDPTNQMDNRGGYLIHGPRANDNQDSSQGCPIFPRDVRDQMANSGDNCFRVVE